MNRVDVLINEQADLIKGFFGKDNHIEIPEPGKWLLEALDINRQVGLFHDGWLCPFYLPDIQLEEGVSFPGLKYPISPWAYERIREGELKPDVFSLPGVWVLFDTTPRPQDLNGAQLYPDTGRFMEMLSTLRKQHNVDDPFYEYRFNPPSPTRFYISGDEVDGKIAAVAKAVADILHLQPQQVNTPSLAAFNYIGNLGYEEFGQVNTSELLRHRSEKNSSDSETSLSGFSRISRLVGGHKGKDGSNGLSRVNFNWSDTHSSETGFRLVISAPV